MPEIESFDLDTAFRDLERDIAGISTPLGAAAAVRGARRRRRTAIGGAVAGFALVASAVAVGVGVLGHDDADVPTDRLPAPAPFDGPHLTAATAGWTPAWGPATDASRAKFSQTFGGPCLEVIPGGHPGFVSLTDTHIDVAFAEMGDYGSKTVQEATDWVRLERQVAGCSGAELVSSFSDPSGALGHTYRIDAAPADSAPEYLWIVSTGREIGVLKIFGQSETLPTANDRPVAQVLLAAIQDHDSYRVVSSPDQPVLRVEEGDFARALGGWRSGWASSADHRSPALASPCYARALQHGSWASQHGGLGGNGRQDVAIFHSAVEARAAVTSLVDAFQGCQGARYRVARSSDDPRSMLVVASGPMVAWVAQQDDAVSVVRVPSGESAPPRSVSVDVGGLMFAWMTSFTGGPDQQVSAQP
jgi:hypothetical protein